MVKTTISCKRPFSWINTESANVRTSERGMSFSLWLFRQFHNIVEKKLFSVQAQHVFSPVMQGGARMITPPSHGQHNLVSSSTTQYGEQTHTMYGKNSTTTLCCSNFLLCYFVSAMSVIFCYGDHCCVFYYILYLVLHVPPLWSGKFFSHSNTQSLSVLLFSLNPHPPAVPTSWCHPPPTSPTTSALSHAYGSGPAEWATCWHKSCCCQPRPAPTAPGVSPPGQCSSTTAANVLRIDANPTLHDSRSSSSVPTGCLHSPSAGSTFIQSQPYGPHAAG